MADSDQVAVFIVAEATVGVTPTSPAMQALRVTTPTISISDRTVESAELRADRMVSDYPSVAQDVTGDIGVEFSYANADQLIEGGMCGAWANKAVLFPAAAAATSFTVASGGVAFRMGALVRGSGFAVAANNGLFKLAADATATTITVAGAAIEAAPPTGAKIKAVGFEGASGDLTALANPARIQITVASGNFLNHDMVPGDWLLMGGKAGGAFAFATAANNGWCRVLSVTATTITFDIVPTGWAADTAVAKTIRFTYGDRLAHGTTRKTFTLQRRFYNIGGSITGYENSRGQEVSTWKVDLAAQDIAKANFSLMGNTGAFVTTQIAGATDVAATTGDIMTTGADMGMIILDGVVVGSADNSFMKTFSLTLDNQLRQRAALGFFGTVGRGLGRLKIEGSTELYFESVATAQKALTNLDTQFAFRVGDSSGRGMLIDMPATKIDGSLSVSGTNSDVMLPLTFKARRHPTLGYMIRVNRYEETV